MYYENSSNTPTIEGKRVVLRFPSADDIPDLEKWLALDEVYTYWGRKASKAEREPALLFADPRPWVKRKPSPDYKWAVTLRESGEVIGLLEIFDVTDNRMGTVGYRFNPKHWGNGYATESLKAAVRFIFTQTSLKRLQARADVRNTASNKVLENCGFIKEGTVRQGKMVDVYCDYNIYGLLDTDFADR